MISPPQKTAVGDAAATVFAAWRDNQIRVQSPLNNPAFRHLDHRFFHRLHKPARRPAPVLRSSGPGMTPISGDRVQSDNARPCSRLRTRYHDRIGEVSFCFTPVHHHHWDWRYSSSIASNGSGYSEHITRDHRRVFAPSSTDKPAVSQDFPRITQNQGVTFLEAIFFNCSMISAK